MIRPVVFGKFALLERLSVGGMAEIYRAKLLNAPHFKRFMVVKRILPSLADDSEFIEMFIDEAKISVEISHPNICQIYELGRLQKAHYMVMEFIPGQDLLQIQKHYRRQKRVMSVSQACFIVAQIASGLDFAHRATDQFNQPLNVIHRDVSPQNILVSYDGAVKLIDFGVAKAASKNTKTQAGVLKGKFGYMSPEQADGVVDIDHRSDVFALGTVFWELLTNRRLFHDENDYMTLEKVRACNVPEPSSINHLVPPHVDAIVLQALQRDRQTRYQWCSEMAQDIVDYLNGCNPPYTQGHLRHWMCSAFAKELKTEHEKIDTFDKLNTPQEVKKFTASLIVEEEWKRAPGDAQKIMDHDGNVVPELEDYEDFEGEDTQVFTHQYDYQTLQGQAGMVLPTLDAGLAETFAEIKAVQIDQARRVAEEESKGRRATRIVVVIAVLVFLTGLGLVSYLFLFQDSEPRAEANTNTAPKGTVSVTVTPPHQDVEVVLIREGQIVARSVPGDAEETRASFAALAFGAYTIGIEHPEFELLNREFSLEGGNLDLNLSLVKRKRATITFEVDPIDAEARLNGKLIVAPGDGTGLRKASVELGVPNELSVGARGHKAQVIEGIVIKPGGETSLDRITLESTAGRIELTINRAANVILKGATPEEDKRVGSGESVTIPIDDTSKKYYLRVERNNYTSVDLVIDDFNEENNFVVKREVTLERMP